MILFNRETAGRNWAVLHAGEMALLSQFVSTVSIKNITIKTVFGESDSKNTALFFCNIFIHSCYLFKVSPIPFPLAESLKVRLPI